MGFDKRGYYYRASKVNGRVVREYIGAGIIGEIAAEDDAILRMERKAEDAERRALQAEMQALDDAVDEFDAVADLLTRAALQVAGYFQHKQGEWRKRRGRKNEEPAGEEGI